MSMIDVSSLIGLTFAAALAFYGLTRVVLAFASGGEEVEEDCREETLKEHGEGTRRHCRDHAA